MPSIRVSQRIGAGLPVSLAALPLSGAALVLGKLVEVDAVDDICGYPFRND
jgi:hypothetical protein